MGAEAQRIPRPRGSHFEVGAARLAELCESNGLGAKTEPAVALFGYLTQPWGERAPGAADDHAPYEFSVAYGGPSPEIRIIVEAQGDAPSRESNWDAGLELSRRLARDFSKVGLERQHAIESLFKPQTGARLGIWHSVCLSADREPDFEVYFGAQAQGRWRAPALVEEALCRLGFRRAWPAVWRPGSRGEELDELMYVSLDLSAAQTACARFYWRHHRATASELAGLLGESTLTELELREFGRAMAGYDGPHDGRPLFSGTALHDPDSDKPWTRTLSIPIRGYAVQGAKTPDRISDYLASRDLPIDRYRALIEQLGRRPVDCTAGLQSHSTSRRGEGQFRVTVYSSPEAHQHGSARRRQLVIPRPGPEPVQPATEIVHRYEEELLLREHPLFRRLERETVDRKILSLIAANLREALVRDGRAPHRPPADEAARLAPARRFREALDRQLFAENPHQVVGALMALAIGGAQAGRCAAEAFARQGVSPPYEMPETLGAGEAPRWARAFPAPDASEEARAQVAAAWRGAGAIMDAAQTWLNELYQVCFAQ